MTTTSPGAVSDTRSGGHRNLEHFCVSGAVDGHAGRRAIPPDGTDHRGGLPVAANCWREPAPRRGASAQPTHVGLGSIHREDQFGRVEPRLVASPRAARSRNVWAVLFAGAECLFLYVSPAWPKHSGWQAAYEINHAGLTQFRQGQIRLPRQKQLHLLLVREECVAWDPKSGGAGRAMSPRSPALL